MSTKEDKKTNKKHIHTSPRKRKLKNLFKSVWIVFQVLIVLLLMGVFFTGAAGAGFFASHIKDEPLRDYDELSESLNSMHQTGEAYFRDGELIGELRTDSHLYPVSLEEISPHMIDAILATEDNEFFEHEGINIRGLARAVQEELLNPGQGTGGSTITQQLIKNQILDPERTLERKFHEMALAMRVENMFDKYDILEAYLNVIYFGFNANGTNIEGVQAAAEGIFDKDVGELNIAESAYLAGMVQAPGRYTPFVGRSSVSEENLERGKTRAGWVLNRMLETERITEEEYEEALDYDYKANLAEPTPRMYDEYPYLTESIEERALTIISNQILDEQDMSEDEIDTTELRQQARRELSRGGYKVYTTIDEDLYNAFHEVAANHDFGSRSSETFTYVDPETGEEEERGHLEQAGATLIDNETGAIIAMLEGRNFDESQIDFTNRPFQPGSSIKPILDYATAFEHGILQPASVLDDVPLFDYNPGGDPPTNFDNRYRGLMTVREALTVSQNIPAIKALRATRDEIGTDQLYEYMQNLGLRHISEEEMSYDSSAIGGSTSGWTVEDSTAAFSTLANEGLYQQPYMIERIETMDGEIVFEHTPDPKQVFSAETSFLINDILRDVVNHGTANLVGQQLSHSGLDIAGKTGTTDEQHDYWFIGYTPQVSLGVWLGYQERDSLDSGYTDRNQGLWVSLMQKVADVSPEFANAEERFAQPDNIVQRTVCSKSGMLPSSICEEAGYIVSDYFHPDFVPREEDDRVIRERVILVNGDPYIAHESTPDDFVQEGEVFIKREPLDIPDYLQHRRSQLLPLDWNDTAPYETDPREDNGKTPDAPGEVQVSGSDISWQSVDEEDIVGYRIYRIGENENVEHIASIPEYEDNSYSDSNASSYIYYITAVDIAGRESSPSDFAVQGDADPDEFLESRREENGDENDDQTDNGAGNSTSDEDGSNGDENDENNEEEEQSDESDGHNGDNGGQSNGDNERGEEENNEEQDNENNGNDDENGGQDENEGNGNDDNDEGEDHD